MRLFKWKPKAFALSWYFYVVLAIAATVTAAQVADAIRNSPYANDWLRANADAVGRLAMFESGGRTDIYNGSCCTGVLQMNRTNIATYAGGISREQFAQLSLQEQVNAWSRLTTTALQSNAPRQLSNMTTFDGRTVTGDLVLACVQLGIGNCQRMINSGSCSGFADRNGTTICHMADRISGGNGTPATPTPGGGGNNATPAPGQAGGTYTPPSFPCVRDENGACLSPAEAMAEGFSAGSGVTMEHLREVLLAASVSLVVVLSIGLMSGTWRQYATGRMEKVDLIYWAQRGALVIMTFFVVMTLV